MNEDGSRGEPTKLWLEFEEPDIGRKRRNDKGSLQTHPTWTPFFTIQKEILRKTKEYSVVRTQFPLRCSFSVTFHKSQGGK